MRGNSVRVPLDLQGDDARIVVRLELLTRKGLVIRGLPTFEQAIPISELPRKRADVAERISMATAVAKEGKHEEVRRIYDRAISEFPENADLLNSYAWYLATTKVSERRPVHAVELARKAVDMCQRKAWYILDTLAEALLCAGQLDEAQRINDEAKVMAFGRGAENVQARDARIEKARIKTGKATP